MNFKNFSVLLFQNKTNKAKQTNSQNSNTLPSARQTTNQRSSNATIPRNCNQFKPGIPFMHCCFGQK